MNFGWDWHKLSKSSVSVPWLINMYNPLKLKQVLAVSFNSPITHLTFHNDFNKTITELPATLTHLRFGCNFNQKVKNLPRSLLYLSFGNLFDHSINSLPPKLTHLYLGCAFKRTIKNLPQHITHLSFGDCFWSDEHDHSGKHDIKLELLPTTLTHLTFNREFNQPLTSLPSITHLTFGINFNQPVNELPSSLIKLVLAPKFNHPVSELPDSLKKLFFGHAFHPNVFKHHYIEFAQSLSTLPPSLSLLSFRGILQANQVLSFREIPPHVTKITLHGLRRHSDVVVALRGLLPNSVETTSRLNHHFLQASKVIIKTE
jgi:hypothetical protein